MRPLCPLGVCIFISLNNYCIESCIFYKTCDRTVYLCVCRAMALYIGLLCYEYTSNNTIIIPAVFCSLRGNIKVKLAFVYLATKLNICIR
jgi:hypothetical protein